MCLWCYASSPVQYQGLLKDKWLLIKHILSPHLSLSLLSVPPVSFPLLPAALPPPEEARLPGRGAVGLASSTLRLITPLILGLPVCLQGENSGMIPPSAPTPTLPVSVPPLSFFLHPLHPSVPVLPQALRDDTKSQLQTGPLVRSACLVRHMSRQMGLLWTLPWTHREKKNDKRRWIGDEGWWLPELGNRVKKIQSAYLKDPKIIVLFQALQKT